MIRGHAALSLALAVAVLSGSASGRSGLLQAAPACPADVGDGPTPPLRTNPDPAASGFPINHGELSDIGEAVRQLAESRYKSVYAGLAINTDADVVDVWSKKSAGFTAEINAQPWANRVRMHEAPYSNADLEPTFFRIIFDDQDYWKDRGPPVMSAAIRHEGTYIEIGTPDPARAELEFPQRYPGAPFCFLEDTSLMVPFADRSG